MAERGEVVREEVLQAIRSELGRPDYGGGDLAGLVVGINRRVNSLRKEPLFTIERRRLGGRLAGIYKVNPPIQGAAPQAARSPGFINFPAAVRGGEA